MEKNWGEWTIQYSTILIIQSINLTQKHSRVEGGNILEIYEAGNQETEYEVTALPGIGEKPWAGHFPSWFLRWVLCHLQNFSDCLKTWGYAGKIERRVEEGNFLNPETVGWDCFPPLTWASQTGDGLGLGHYLRCPSLNGHQRREWLSNRGIPFSVSWQPGSGGVSRKNQELNSVSSNCSLQSGDRFFP